MKTYSLYQIHKDGLLKNYDGVPYKDKRAIRFRLMKAGLYPTSPTHGQPKYRLTEKQLKKLNSLS